MGDLISGRSPLKVPYRCKEILWIDSACNYSIYKLLEQSETSPLFRRFFIKTPGWYESDSVYVFSLDS